MAKQFVHHAEGNQEYRPLRNDAEYIDRYYIDIHKNNRYTHIYICVCVLSCWWSEMIYIILIPIQKRRFEMLFTIQPRHFEIMFFLQVDMKKTTGHIYPTH